MLQLLVALNATANMLLQSNVLSGTILPVYAQAAASNNTNKKTFAEACKPLRKIAKATAAEPSQASNKVNNVINSIMTKQ